MGFATVLAFVSDGDTPTTVWTIGDWVALALLASFFGFLGLGAWKLWRIKQRGLLGHEHVVLELGDWFLVWPGWWPDPRATGPGWWAGSLDHDGRLELIPLEGARAQMEPQAFLFQVLEERGVLVVPDILANGGAVVSSYFEWVQSRTGLTWIEAVTTKRMSRFMREAWEAVLEVQEEFDCQLREAAQILAVRRISQADQLRGIYA